MSKKLCNLNAGDVVDITVRVIRADRGYYLHKEKGNSLKAYRFLIADGTRFAELHVFKEDAKVLEDRVGQVISIQNGVVKINGSIPEVWLETPGCWSEVSIPGFPAPDEPGESEVHQRIKRLKPLQVNQVYHLQVVGIFYTRHGNYVAGLASGTVLDLKPEPDNQHDDFAVSVWHDRVKLGYLPRKENKPYFKALLEGKPPVECLLGCYVPRDETAATKRYAPPRANVTISTYEYKVEWRPLVMYPEDLVAY